jgi:hypothetical protein
MRNDTVKVTIRDHDNVTTFTSVPGSATAVTAFHDALSAADTFGAVYYREPALFYGHCYEHSSQRSEAQPCFVGELTQVRGA